MKKIIDTTSKNTDPAKSKAILTIAKNIRYFRMELGISQENLAELSELHRNYIGQCERAEVNISILNLEAIAKALKVDISNLVIQHTVVNYHK